MGACTVTCRPYLVVRGERCRVHGILDYHTVARIWYPRFVPLHCASAYSSMLVRIPVALVTCEPATLDSLEKDSGNKGNLYRDT